MSAAKMVADSTQSEPADCLDGKKKKKKLKKTGKKIVLPEDEDSDLDLKKELKPISAYIKDRPAMIREMFRAVRGASLHRALPDLLKSIPRDELEQLCLEQLEVMSKKRIRRIMAGEDSTNISSSGTEDETSDEEVAVPDEPAADVPAESHPPDSTRQDISTQQDPAQDTEESENVEIKHEPPESGEEEEGVETYTSGSEDGELVIKEEMTEDDVHIKQEPASGDEEMDDKDEDEMSDIEDDLMASMQGAADDVLPSIMMDQMELLELEMRARAIKAMLSSHDDGDS
ncbi:caspase activity and apoptosis inhibitor 1-like [Physella acuta]|uniref:caspase activity and apoptosis inhibitor 1-like n=1 Tax=Physella acuta TaxID=109671 RepID=UPI0027DCC792|nr:caspase activity and apoptosis inhibitor 1-like [Physella acuta]XP_059174993.1 caspase activity and apoptosis inhibitor 1-like [Physella acuta]